MLSYTHTFFIMYFWYVYYDYPKTLIIYSNHHHIISAIIIINNIFPHRYRAIENFLANKVPVHIHHNLFSQLKRILDIYHRLPSNALCGPYLLPRTKWHHFISVKKISRPYFLKYIHIKNILKLVRDKRNVKISSCIKSLSEAPTSE